MQKEIKVHYEERNAEIANKLIAGELTVREALREMNKNLGDTLVKLSEIRH